MKNYLILLIVMCIGMGALENNAFALFNSAKVTLVVVDEDGKPLEGMDAGVGFEKNTGWGTDVSAKRGLTDANGRFIASGSCNGHIGYGARKEGYYRSHYDYEFKDHGSFGWEPWNPELNIVMRKIENPVPMYSRKLGLSKRIEIPVLDREIGFDLIVSDWVAPYGNGQNSDFLFLLKRSSLNQEAFESELTITFKNTNDGIIKYEERIKGGSKFRLDRFAPDNGYQKK